MSSSRLDDETLRPLRCILHYCLTSFSPFPSLCLSLPFCSPCSFSTNFHPISDTDGKYRKNFTKIHLRLPFLFYPYTDTCAVSTYTKAHTTSTAESSILSPFPPRPTLIYSPSEVDDFRYFSSAVSSKQLPFPNVHPDRAHPTVSPFFLLARVFLALLGYPLTLRGHRSAKLPLLASSIPHLRKVQGTTIIEEISYRYGQKSARRL